MALPKLFQRIFWHNNTTPAINEDNLNAISKAVDDIDDRVIDLAGTIMEDVPVIQHDLEILEPAIENIDANVERAETAADNAETEALKSEGYAVGKQDGVAVTSGEYYQNNAKYYAEIANPPIENTVDFANIITVTDAINKAAKDVRLKVEAIQDLHGYTKPWVGGAGDNLLDIGESISDWFATGSNGTTIVDGDISTKVTATITSLTGSIKVTNYNNTGYWWMSKVVKLKKNTNYKCYYGNAGGSAPILFGFSNLNVGTVGTQITPFYNTQSFNSGNYEYVVISIYPSNINVTQMQIKEASASATFTPYTNICPITGHSEVNVTRAGKNLANLIQGTLNVNTGEWTSSNTRVVTDFVRVEPNKKYKASTNGWAVRNGCYYNKDKEFLFGNTESCYPNVSTNILTVPNNADIAFVRIIYSHSNTSENCSPTDFWYQLEAGETATAYEPYMGEVFTIDLNGTRYGGTLDVTSGVLTVDRAYGSGTVTGINDSYANITYGTFDKAADSAAKGNYNKFDIISSMFYSPTTEPSNWNDAANVGGIFMTASTNLYWVGFPKGTTQAEMETATADHKIVYKLATPQTIQLTAEEVYLLYGYNTLFGDCGDISLTYDTSGIIHIAEAKLDTETLKTIAAASSDFADFKARIAAL